LQHLAAAAIYAECLGNGQNVSARGVRLSSESRQS
jgi:hypothetical protein